MSIPMSTTDVPLTEAMVLSKTRVPKLEDVKRLVCCGEGVTSVDVVRLLPKVEVVSLSINRIASLQSFANCANLEELYLRRNAVQNLREVTALRGLKKLQTLWLKDNPCSTHPHYRDFVLHCCQRLKHLDDVEVTQEERAVAAQRLTPRTLDVILERPSSASLLSSAHGGAAANEAASPVGPSAPVANAMGAANAATPGDANNEAGDVENVGAVAFTTQQTQRAMVTAIVSLLPELTIESLELVRQQVVERITKKQALAGIGDYLISSNNYPV